MRISGAFRRELNTACWACRKRKVRCDAVNGESCTSCNRAGTECRPHPNQNRPTRSLRNRNVRDNSASNASPRTPSDKESDNNNCQTSLRPIQISPAGTGVENLSNFFDRGIISSDWEQFEESNETIRIVYIGTETANLHHLVRNNERPTDNCLSYPFPSFRDPLPWKPHSYLNSHSYMTEDMLCDLSSFPTRLVRDALIDTYFKDIHPCFPIIDEADFHRRYADPTDPPPLLIFHAVLLAAARISDHPMVAKYREMVTATLFRRAKALFDLRYENDRLHLIQAAFLLAWHTENSDTIASNAYHWIGTAVRIAFGLGVHRGNVGVVAKYLPPSEYGTHRIYKRVWWSLLHAEVFSALEFGRPCMIRTDDFDVGALEDGDFQNMNDSEDNIANRHFCYVMSDLCLVALDILDLHSPRSKTLLINNSTINHRLAAVALRIPSSHGFWSCQLRINYNLVVLILHRTDNDMDAASLCSEAASNILTTFETMAVQGTIRQCYLTSSTALMAAAIQFSREVKLAIVKGSIMKAVSTHSQLERLLAPAKALSEYWPNVDAVCRLCKSLSARAEVLIKGWQIQNSPSLQNMEFPADMDVVWQDIMADFRDSNFGLGLEVEDWMNISSLRSNYEYES